VGSLDEDVRARFAALFADLSPRVFAYARRHCGLSAAQDVVSETSLVAWRRRDDVAEPTLPWLLVVARNVMANRLRGELRRDRLGNVVTRLAQIAGPEPGADQMVVERAVMISALGELTELEREALLLVAWDGLSNHDAARVVGCSVRAFEVRLSRARARLERAIAAFAPDRDRSGLLKGSVTA
jgi:RNA polymerase sigma-70 factor (ECF subfamily)